MAHINHKERGRPRQTFPRPAAKAAGLREAGVVEAGEGTHVPKSPRGVRTKARLEHIGVFIPRQVRSTLAGVGSSQGGDTRDRGGNLSPAYRVKSAGGE